MGAITGARTAPKTSRAGLSSSRPTLITPSSQQREQEEIKRWRRAMGDLIDKFGPFIGIERRQQTTRSAPARGRQAVGVVGEIFCGWQIHTLIIQENNKNHL